MEIQMKADPMIKDLESVSKKLSNELRIVSSKTATKAQSFIAKQVTEELAVAQKVVKKQLVRKQIGKVGFIVVLNKSKKIPLRDFNPRHKKKGVSYKISKKRGTETIEGAFMGPRPGLRKITFNNRVYKRKGQAKTPLRQIYGPSPWGVFIKQKSLKPVGEQIRTELRKQLKERLRYRRLKAEGKI